MRICGGIVTYNPKIDLLIEDINSIIKQIDHLIIVDNSSFNVKEIYNSIKQYDKVEFISNSNNFGIAKALNQIAEKSLSEGFEWLLTLDQDSICSSDIVKNYLNLIQYKKNVGIVNSLIKDRASGNVIGAEIAEGQDFAIVNQCITSGSFTNLLAWKQVGGFDEKMFIEWVDYDFCATLREHGYSIYCINYVGVLQQFATPELKKLFYKSKPIYVYNYSPLRKYYQVRNELYFMRKHNESLNVHLKNICLRLVRTILQEDQKIKKTFQIIKGIFAGLTMSINRKGNLIK